jgi:hypothetical protein
MHFTKSGFSIYFRWMLSMQQGSMYSGWDGRFCMQLGAQMHASA